MPTPLQVPSFSINDIKKSPLAVVIILLICSNVYFINLASSGVSECNRRVDVMQGRLDSMNGKYFDAMISMKGYKELAEQKDKALIIKDSVLRQKTEHQAKQIINTANK